MRVGLYPRVSTSEQATEGYSIGEQTERLTKYCEAMNWTVHKVYTDAGYSGANTDRPGLQALIRDVKAGKLDKVVVYKLDRLSRSQLDTLYLIEKVFLANNTDFVSMSENFDTSTPFGRAMIGILAVFAQLEREQIKERMMVGKEGRAKEGLFHGSATYPIGYDYVDGKLVVNDYEAMQVREAYELFIGGMPIRTMIRKFCEKGYRHKYGTWQTITMNRVLSNPVYIGKIKHKDTYYQGTHEPILDIDTFAKATSLMDERKEKYKKYRKRAGGHSTYLGGFLYCACCGKKYGKKYGGKLISGEKILYYSCCAKINHSTHPERDNQCTNKSYRMENLDKLVFDEIRKLKADPVYFHMLAEKSPYEPNNRDREEVIKAEIKRIDDQVSRVMDLYAIGSLSIDVISAKINPLTESKHRLEDELASIEAEKVDVLSEKDAREMIDSFEDVLERGDLLETRRLLEGLIDRIVIDGDDITIYWRFQ